MSEIHIATRDGQKAVYLETEIPPAIAEGRIPDGALYWQEGMPDWRSVSELKMRLQGPSSAPPPPPSQYKYFKDPTQLTTILTFALYAQAVVALISLFSDLAQLSLLGSNYTEQAGAANDARQQIVGLFYLLVFLVTGILFLVWINRANKNCRGFTSGMEFSPGWAVGWYFIPFANLIKPFQAMSEIWRVSHNPMNWKTMEPPALLRWWWGIWLLSSFLGQASFRMAMKAQTLDALQSSTTISILNEGVDIVLCVVAVMMIGKIFKAQQNLVVGSLQ
jgi:hypothetical protein